MLAPPAARRARASLRTRILRIKAILAFFTSASRCSCVRFGSSASTRLSCSSFSSASASSLGVRRSEPAGSMVWLAVCCGVGRMGKVGPKPVTASRGERRTALWTQGKSWAESVPAHMRQTRDVVPHSRGEALAATNSTFPRAFDPASFRQGPGLMVEGPIVELRHHTLKDSAGAYHRFLAVVVDCTGGHLRVFNAQGVEVEADQSKIDRKRTGFATWSTGVVAAANALTATQIVERLGGVGIPADWHAQGGAALHPAVTNRVEFWAPRALLVDAKLAIGAVIKIKTAGDSHLVDTLWLKDATTLTKGTSYAGEDVGSGWAGKVEQAAQQPQQHAPPKPDANKEAVADDEW